MLASGMRFNKKKIIAEPLNLVFFPLNFLSNDCVYILFSGSNSATESNGVISFSTPNSFQQFFSPTFGQFGAIYAASLAPSSSSTAPQVLKFLQMKTTISFQKAIRKRMANAYILFVASSCKLSKSWNCQLLIRYV